MYITDETQKVEEKIIEAMKAAVDISYELNMTHGVRNNDLELALMYLRQAKRAIRKAS